MKLLARVTLAFQEGASDKVYEIDLCEVGAGQHVVNEASHACGVMHATPCHKLLAAKAAAFAGRSDGVAHTLSHRSEHAITDRMPPVVVDRLRRPL